MNVLLENDAISGFQVNLAFTFVLEERDAAPDPPRGQEGDTTTAQSDVPMGTTTSYTAPGTTTGTTASRDAPPDAPRRQEERSVRQSEKRREEDRGREEDKGLIDRAVDSLTGREDESEPRRGEQGQDGPRR